MSFDWTEYNNLAREIINPSAPLSVRKAIATLESLNEEARLRCAISRSYYSAYCNARNYLQINENKTIPVVDSHKFVINNFFHSSGLKQKIGIELRELMSERIKADYHNNQNNINYQLADLCVKKSFNIIEKIEKLKSTNN